MKEFYKPGDYLINCDRTGEKAFRSDCVKEWNGLIVKKEYAEARHPLDLQRPPPVEWVPKDTRPVSEVFVEWGDITEGNF